MEAPRPLTFARKRLPENIDTKHQKMTGVIELHREGEARTQGVRRYQQEANPLGAGRDLGAGRGRKRGNKRTQEAAADTGTWHEAQRQATEAGGWQGQLKSRWATYHASRRVGERVIQRDR